MDEKRTDYEPNFILKDAEIKEALEETPIAENPSYVKADTFQGGARPRPTPQPTTPNDAQGLYRDPREGFRNPGEGHRSSGERRSAGASASWSGGKARAEGTSFFRGTGAEGSNTRSSVRSAGSGRRGAKSGGVTLSKKALALLVACCMALSCLCGIGGAYIGHSMLNDNTAEVMTAEETDSAAGAVSTTGYNLQNATGSNLTIQEITKTAQKSVVEIRTEGMVSDSWMQQYVTEGAGSGVIISKDGYIMTNNHVIDGANKITVTTSDKHSYEATLVGADPVNDVAVLKIKATGLTPAVYGNSDQLQVGDMAVAIGNPLGELGGTVTAGIISATDRELAIDGRTMKLLQTDSSINPGNSGGGLFNGDGQLIGLVVAKSAGSDVEGLGFAIPINTAASVAQQLMDKGYVSGQPWTGMTYTEGSSGLDFLFGDSFGGTVYIYSVDTKVAKQAGFKAGDMVYAIDDHQISSIDDLVSVIESHKVGDKLKYTVVRDGQELDLTITLQEKTKAQTQDGN